MEEKLKYFKLAKSLNEKFHKQLLEMEAHFRGSINSYSLISLNRNTPEKGKSGIKKIYNESDLLKFKPDIPGRETQEKILQAWIILNAIQNNQILPFGDDLTFITSELALKLDDNKRIVNDILAIDKEGNLVVIELKSSRVNEVKKQANNFKKEIELQKDFFRELTFLMTNREWNGKVRCIIVWPKVESIARKNPEEYKEVEEYQYSKKGEGFIIKNANSCK